MSADDITDALTTVQCRSVVRIVLRAVERYDETSSLVELVRGIIQAVSAARQMAVTL